MSKYGFAEEDTPAISLPKPKASAPRPPAELVSEAAKVGESLGFVSREPRKDQPRRGGRRRVEPQDKVLITGPARVITAFRAYCDANDLHYWTALEQLLEAASSSPSVEPSAED